MVGQVLFTYVKHVSAFVVRTQSVHPLKGHSHVEWIAFDVKKFVHGPGFASVNVSSFFFSSVTIPLVHRYELTQAVDKAISGVDRTEQWSEEVWMVGENESPTIESNASVCAEQMNCPADSEYVMVLVLGNMNRDKPSQRHTSSSFAQGTNAVQSVNELHKRFEVAFGART